MLIGSITAAAAVLAALICALAGGFGSLAWLWLLLSFCGSWLVLLALAFLFLYIVAQRVDLDKPQEEDDPFYRRVVDLYVPALIWLVRLKITASGLEQTPREGRFMLVCNHLSQADPGVLLAYFKDSQLAFISKKENLNMFIIGKMMHKILCQPLDRENDRAALKTILKCIQIIKEDKVSIGVFPEGYTSRDGLLHNFRPGAFKIAQKAQVPIVVCTLRGTRELFHNLAKLKPTQAELHLVGVIPAADLVGRTTVDIAQQVHAMMAADLGPDLVAQE